MFKVLCGLCMRNVPPINPHCPSNTDNYGLRQKQFAEMCSLIDGVRLDVCTQLDFVGYEGVGD